MTLSTSLSWRIPTSGDPRLLRLALAQVGLATIVAALVLLVAIPRNWLVPALAGLIPLAVMMAYRRWSLYQQSLGGADNVQIDREGVHWLDAKGERQTLHREDVTGYRIGHDHETLRPVPALTLLLARGFESQPIELHPPATPDAMRRLLAETWKLEESSPAANETYDDLVHVYSECHDEFQEWHWEGTRSELLRFFGLLAAAADELPLPPPGAKPLTRIVLANRRQPVRLHLAHAVAARFTAETIAGPAPLLRDIAAQAQAALAPAAETSDTRFDVRLAAHDVWTFHLHVRPL